MQVYSESVGLKTIYDLEYMQKKWESYGENVEERCMMCYKTRLERTVLYAKNNGYEYFTTTLLVSPYQKHECIKELSFELGEKNNIKFYYDDFRDGFRYGQKKAKDMGLYRQKYCGCIMSLNQK